VIIRVRTACVLACVAAAALWPNLASAAPDAVGDVAQIGEFVEQGSGGSGGASTALRVLLVMTVLSLLPALVLTMTAFTRIIIVFSFLRQALGIQGMPPNQVLTGMALFLTAFIMAPVATEVHEQAIAPLMADEIGAMQALDHGSKPLAAFMLKHVDDEDLRLFYDISDRPRPATRADVDFVVLVPAFVLGEVRTAFEMGFLVLIPFMVIDLVVSSILMAMGMVMLPPALVTLPIKVMVFVLVDGWGLVIGSLVRSFA
jgi:flagellar biosynthetic protein FliP